MKKITTVLALGAVMVWVLTDSLILAVPAFFGLALLPRLLYAWLRKRRLRKFEEQLPDALMMLAGGLRAGASLTSAVQQLVAESQNPLAQEFSLVLREQRLGVSMEQSLNRRWAGRNPGAHLEHRAQPFADGRQDRRTDGAGQVAGVGRGVVAGVADAGSQPDGARCHGPALALAPGLGHLGGAGIPGVHGRVSDPQDHDD